MGKFKLEEKDPPLLLELVLPGNVPPNFPANSKESRLSLASAQGFLLHWAPAAYKMRTGALTWKQRVCNGNLGECLQLSAICIANCWRPSCSALKQARRTAAMQPCCSTKCKS